MAHKFVDAHAAPPPQSPVLTTDELAAYLRVHPSTVYRLVKRGSIPWFKIGSDYRFNTEAIDEWRLKSRGRNVH